MQVTWKGLLLRAVGLGYILIGVAFGFLTVGQIVSWAIGDMKYEVPQACLHAPCCHEKVTSPDGRTYCAPYPPKDIKFSGTSLVVVVNTCVDRFPLPNAMLLSFPLPPPYRP
jgi:hypothetical protein